MLLLLAGAYVVYQLGMAVLRSYTTSRIEAAAGRPLPQFALRDRDGELLRSEELRGRRVVLNFFRSRCHSCLQEAAAIRALAAELDPRDTVLLGVLVDRIQGFSQAESDATLAAMGYQHRILLADEAFADAFHGAGWSHITPVTYVADANGVIRATLRGNHDLDALRAAVTAAGK